MPNEAVPSPDLASLLALVVDAAEAAGAMLRAEFHRPGGPRGHGTQADIDEAVEAMLRTRLCAAFPCRWLGEETRPGTSDSDFVWVVDPHDGTEAFLGNWRGSSVSVALLDAGRPVLGVVHAFAFPTDCGDLLAWAEGCGPVQRNGVALAPLQDRAPGKADVVALSQAAREAAEANALIAAPLRVLAMPSIAYRLALAAAGEVAVGASIVGLQSWDVAGGHALLIGAGGVLLDGAGRPVTYDRQGCAAPRGCFGGSATAARVLAGKRWRDLLGNKGPTRQATPVRRVTGAARLDRAQGCLLGQVAGDALGALVEFESAAAIARRYPEGLRTLADGGPWSIIAGQATDDSEMALALARAVVRNSGYAPQEAFRAYKAWIASGPFDVGGTTAAALGLWFEEAGTATGHSQANGSLMRASPIGIASAGDPRQAARSAAADSLLTHPHPVCVAACRAYAAAIAGGIATGDRAAMIAAALDHAGGDAGAATVRAVVGRSRTAAPVDYQRQMGWVLIALQNAFHHLAEGHGVEEALSGTIMQGGDTDTNAAIAGALLGAAEGMSRMPVAWRMAVTTCRPLATTGARQPRPPEYWPDDVLDLAETLLALSQA